jgi:hypothetical protein
MERLFSRTLGKREKEIEPSIIEDYNNSSEEDPPPAVEVEMGIKKLKKHKAPGIDKIPAALFKHAGSELIKQLHTVLKEIRLKEKMRTDWNLSIIATYIKRETSWNVQTIEV